jgi:SpoVK/Ycf46/Vps4 family AAA+-type ATPase
MTSNHPEKLDPALIRPGRVNLKLYLGYIQLEEAKEMVKVRYDGAAYDSAAFDSYWCCWRVMACDGVCWRVLVRAGMRWHEMA